jgi:hypothetical protein
LVCFKLGGVRSVPLGLTLAEGSQVSWVWSGQVLDLDKSEVGFDFSQRGSG